MIFSFWLFCLLWNFCISSILSASSTQEIGLTFLEHLIGLIEEEEGKLVGEEEEDSFSFDEVDAVNALEGINPATLNPRLYERRAAFLSVLSLRDGKEIALARVLPPLLNRFWAEKVAFDDEVKATIEVIKGTMATDVEGSLTYAIKCRMINLLQKSPFDYFNDADLEPYLQTLYNSPQYQDFMKICVEDFVFDYPELCNEYAEIFGILQWLDDPDHLLRSPGPAKLMIASLLKDQVFDKFSEAVSEYEDCEEIESKLMNSGTIDDEHVDSRVPEDEQIVLSPDSSDSDYEFHSIIDSDEIVSADYQSASSQVAAEASTSPSMQPALSQVSSPCTLADEDKDEAPAAVEDEDAERDQDIIDDEDAEREQVIIDDHDSERDQDIIDDHDAERDQDIIDDQDAETLSAKSASTAMSAVSTASTASKSSKTSSSSSSSSSHFTIDSDVTMAPQYLPAKNHVKPISTANAREKEESIDISASPALTAQTVFNTPSTDAEANEEESFSMSVWMVACVVGLVLLCSGLLFMYFKRRFDSSEPSELLEN